jgi:hypothetical protein
LFRAIVARQIAGVEEELQPTYGGHDEPLEDKIRTYVNVALKRSLRHDVVEINRLILGESYQFPELAEAARARFRFGVQHIVQLITECAKRDRIPCRNATAAAELFMYAVYGWYTSIVIANRIVTEKERTSWIDIALENFLGGRTAW